MGGKSDRSGIDLATFLLAWKRSSRKPDRELVEAGLEVFHRGDLFTRTDSIGGGATVLLTQAADGLDYAAMTLFEEGGTSPEVLRIVETAIQAAKDAQLLASINPEEDTSPRLLRRLPDGTYTTAPGDDPEGGVTPWRSLGDR
jgi:hypothetical protein